MSSITIIYVTLMMWLAMSAAGAIVLLAVAIPVGGAVWLWRALWRL